MKKHQKLLLRGCAEANRVNDRQDPLECEPSPLTYLTYLYLYNASLGTK